MDIIPKNTILHMTKSINKILDVQKTYERNTISYQLIKAILNDEKYITLSKRIMTEDEYNQIIGAGYIIKIFNDEIHPSLYSYSPKTYSEYVSIKDIYSVNTIIEIL